jgi:hypothetical protein
VKKQQNNYSLQKLNIMKTLDKAQLRQVKGGRQLSMGYSPVSPVFFNRNRILIEYQAIRASETTL